MVEMEPSKTDLLAKIMDEMFKPNVSKELAIELASKLYGLEVMDIKSLNSFSDQNFLIKVSKEHHNPYIEDVSDKGYVLKIINTFKSNIENHFDSIHAGMIHLFDKGLRVPQPVKNLEGSTWKLKVVPLQEKEKKYDKVYKCGIHLLTYIPGVPVAMIRNTENNFFEWGTLLARFHNALEDLECPALQSKMNLSNVEHFDVMRAYLGGIPEGAFDEEARTLIQNVLERYPSELQVHLKDVPQGFVHGDFNDHNILAQPITGSPQEAYEADGILDFDDMHRGSYVWDLGLMLAHLLMVQKTVDDLEAAGHAVAGYRSVRKLGEREVSLLKICMECRLSMMSLISVISKDDPSNSYILMLSALEPKKNMLKRLAGTDVKELLESWDTIYKQRNVDKK